MDFEGVDKKICFYLQEFNGNYTLWVQDSASLPEEMKDVWSVLSAPISQEEWKLGVHYKLALEIAKGNPQSLERQIGTNKRKEASV